MQGAQELETQDPEDPHAFVVAQGLQGSLEKKKDMEKVNRGRLVVYRRAECLWDLTRNRESHRFTCCKAPYPIANVFLPHSAQSTRQKL